MIITIILLLLIILLLVFLQKVTINQLEEELDCADQLEAIKDQQINNLREGLGLPKENIPKPEDYPSRGRLRRAQRRPDSPIIGELQSVLLPDWAPLPPGWEWAD